MNIRQRARELAIKAAHQDPDLHGYTLDARLLKPWEPHAWVVNAVAEALQGEADAPAPEDEARKLARIGKVPSHIVSQLSGMFDARVEPLHRRLDRLSSLVATLDKQRQDGDTCSAHAVRLVQLERKIDDVAKQTLETLQAQGKLIAKLQAPPDFEGVELPGYKELRAMARKGPPPGVPALPLTSEERPGVAAVHLEPDPTTESIQRATMHRGHLAHMLTERTIERDNARQTGDALRAALRNVWEQLAQPDGYGTPYWGEPGLDDTSAADAVIAVLDHLRAQIDSLRHEKAHLQNQIEEHKELEVKRVQLIDTQSERRVEAQTETQHLRIERDEALGAAEMVQLKLSGVEHTCIDQARQIAELRGEINQMRQAHHAELCRKDANRESDFAEGREQNKRLIADNQLMRVENHRLRDSLAHTDDLRRKAEGACTDYGARVRNLEAQAARREQLHEEITHTASQVPTLRAQLDEAKASVTRMQPLVATVERWSHSRGLGVDLSYAGVAQYAASGADAGLLDAYAAYQAECTTAADNAKDCQEGTCDCPKHSGTVDITGDPPDDDAGMPF